MFVLVWLLHGLWAVLSPVFAQEGGGGGTQIVPERSYMIEILLVLVLFGAALFAVCKSSRRV